jgi:hypothetical protein
MVVMLSLLVLLLYLLPSKDDMNIQQKKIQHVAVNTVGLASKNRLRKQ